MTKLIEKNKYKIRSYYNNVNWKVEWENKGLNRGKKISLKV